MSHLSMTDMIRKCCKTHKWCELSEIGRGRGETHGHLWKAQTIFTLRSMLISHNDSNKPVISFPDKIAPDIYSINIINLPASDSTSGQGILQIPYICTASSGGKKNQWQCETAGHPLWLPAMLSTAASLSCCPTLGQVHLKEREAVIHFSTLSSTKHISRPLSQIVAHDTWRRGQGWGAAEREAALLGVFFFSIVHMSFHNLYWGENWPCNVTATAFNQKGKWSRSINSLPHSRAGCCFVTA